MKNWVGRQDFQAGHPVVTMMPPWETLPMDAKQKPTGTLTRKIAKHSSQENFWGVKIHLMANRASGQFTPL